MRLTIQTIGAGLVSRGLARVSCITVMVFGGCAEDRDEEPVIRNVVLVSVDTVRADHLEPYGYERPTSPFLNELAARGVLFERALAQAPWTTPSHAAMLASNYPAALGLGTFFDQRPLPEEAVLLARVLQGAGFRTCGIVDGGLVSRLFGFHRGFDDFEDQPKGMEVAVDLAARWLDDRSGDEPFFMFLHTYDVHHYVARGPGRELVRPYDGPLRQEARLSKLVQSRAQRPTVAGFSESDRQFVVDQYDGGIRGVDEQLRRLCAALESRGLMDETLIVVTSDHGEELFDHGLSGHGYTLYDENLHVPLIMAHPSLPAVRVKEQVRLIDLAPTVVDLLGLESPASWQGMSLRSFLSGESRPLTVFSSHTHHKPTVSIRTGAMKYILREETPAQLFDLAEDPRETVNLAGRGHPAEEELDVRLDRWVELNESLRGGVEPGAGVGFEEEMRAQLRALGYLDDDEG